VRHECRDSTAGLVALGAWLLSQHPGAVCPRCVRWCPWVLCGASAPWYVPARDYRGGSGFRGGSGASQARMPAVKTGPRGGSRSRRRSSSKVPSASELVSSSFAQRSGCLTGRGDLFDAGWPGCLAGPGGTRAGSGLPVTIRAEDDHVTAAPGDAPVNAGGSWYTDCAGQSQSRSHA
jgi:hypothetical protein